MSPALRPGSLCISTLRRGAPLRKGDVVVAFVDGEHIVKRVAYLPGELISWQDSDGLPRVVPAGTVWLLGDNAAVSYDSRMFGAVPLERIHEILL